MRRREPALDPAVAAELEALEAALAGDPAAEPELTALVRDVRAEAPEMTLEFRARLDRRVERGFERAPARRRFASLRPMIPALGVAGCVLAALVAVVLSAGGGSKDSAGSAGGSGVAAPVQAESSDAAKSSGSGSAGSAGGSASSSSSSPAFKAPAPSAPARQRRVERSTRLELTTSDVQAASDGVVRATQATGGFVQSSQVSTGDGRSTASFVLRVPTSRLDDALARLSRLGHVRSLQQSADDITNVYDAASTRLAEARAERRGLLRALARATTAAEISSLRARIADNRRALQRDQREFDAVRNRANYATIGLELTGVARKHAAVPSGGSWTPGDAAHDAVRVLEVSAGVALIALAVLVPLTLVGAAGGFAAVAVRRRRREAALSS
ncbi:MAG TPA: DUF4349 domain-containing protein [Solirubrobacteraceae bacterium]